MLHGVGYQSPAASRRPLRSRNEVGHRAPVLNAFSKGTTLISDSAHLAKQLQRDGFVVLPSKLESDIGEVRAAIHERLEKLLQAVEAIGCDPLEQQYSFAEICHRSRYRWDMPMPNELIFNSFCSRVLEAATPILNEVTGGKALRIELSGVVVSRPGAPAQEFHSDGACDLFNVFVPLVDIAPDSDGTEFWTGSHMFDFDKAISALSSESVDLATQMLRPSVDAGGLPIGDLKVQQIFKYTCR